MTHVTKREALDLMRGTQYLTIFIRYFNKLPYELSDEYQFKFDMNDSLGLYLFEKGKYQEVMIFDGIKKPKKHKYNLLRQLLKF